MSSNVPIASSADITAPTPQNTPLTHAPISFPPLALNEAKVEVRIWFKDVAQGILKGISRTELVICIQPSKAVFFKLDLPSVFLSIISRMSFS